MSEEHGDGSSPSPGNSTDEDQRESINDMHNTVREREQPTQVKQLLFSVIIRSTKKKKICSLEHSRHSSLVFERANFNSRSLAQAVLSLLNNNKEYRNYKKISKTNGNMVTVDNIEKCIRVKKSAKGGEEAMLVMSTLEHDALLDRLDGVFLRKVKYGGGGDGNTVIARDGVCQFDCLVPLWDMKP
eukprot:Pgem_evm1s6240